MSQFRETPDSDVLYFLHLVQAALARVLEILRPTRVEERLHPGVSAKSKHKLVRFALKLPFLPEPDTVEHQSNTLKCYPAHLKVVKRFLNTSATKATSAAGASWLEMAAPPRPRVVPSEGAVLQQESGQLQLLEVPGRAPLLGALALGPLGGEGVSHLLVDRSGSRRPRSSSQGNHAYSPHAVLNTTATRFFVPPGEDDSGLLWRQSCIWSILAQRAEELLACGPSLWSMRQRQRQPHAQNTQANFQASSMASLCKTSGWRPAFNRV